MRRSTLALLLSLSVLAGVTPTEGAITRAPAAPSFPFTGTAEIRYTRLPWYYLPANATEYAGNYDLVVHFAVRDPQHFRIDTQTMTPAIESGTRTIVVRGRSVLAYDTRTESAVRGTFNVPTATRLPAVYRTSLLSSLLTAGSFGPGGPLPAGVRSAAAYTRQLRRLLSRRYPPEFPPSYARVTGQATVAGHLADVVQYGPLVITDTLTGCSFTHPARCVHHYRSIGSERIWIDRNHPFVLQAHAYTPTDPHALGLLAGGTSFRVTTIRFGVGPSAANLAFVPPVSVSQRGNVNLDFSLGSQIGGGTGPPPLPPGFVDLPQPNRLSVDEGYSIYANGLSRQTTGVDFLYSDGRHHIVYAHPGDRYGFGLYMSGAYLYVQERLQVHGLPAVLQAGRPGAAGSCSVWTGRYGGGQHWIALARGRVSFLIVSNALSRKQLTAYVARSVCASAERE